jgi:amidase
MTNPAFLSAARLARLVRSRKIGALELLELYAARIRKYDSGINAVVVKDMARARRAARAADAVLAKPRTAMTPPPLFGVPMTVKESFDVAGLPTTWGLEAFKDTRAGSDALAVQRLRAAGAVVFGKTNVPVLLADYQSFNPVYGSTSNPWDLERVPGGSSGGSAAALAAGLTALEYGSDIAGSIRNPAHFCGVYGHKPTFGLVPTRGHTVHGAVAPADILSVGPLARSAEDLALALAATAGPDAPEGGAMKLALPRPLQRSLKEFRVAVLATHETSEVDESVQAQLHALGRFLSRQGAKVSYKARPAFDLDEANRVFIQLLRAATSWLQPPELFARFQQVAREAPADDRGYRAQMARGNTMLHRDWLLLNEQRQRMRLAWADFFRDWDLLLCPVAAVPASPHQQTGERWERMVTVNGRAQPSTQQMFWCGWTGMAGLPATAAPVGLTQAEQLPVGVQIVGPQYGDLSCIAFARLLEREYYRFTPPAGYD